MKIFAAEIICVSVHLLERNSSPSLRIKKYIYNRLKMQGVLLDILVAKGIIQPHHFWLDTENIAVAIQNILICVEMMMFAVLHQYAYYVTPYSGGFEAKLKLQRDRD